MEDRNYGVSLGQILSTAFKKWWIILIATVLGAIALLGYTTYFVTPKYSSKADLGVFNADMSSYQDVVMGQMIAKECSDILKSDITLQKAAENLNKYSFPENNGKPYRVYTADRLRSMISTTTSMDTRFFNVSVTSSNAQEAKLVCDFVTKAFCDVLEVENLISGAEGKVITPPFVASSPSSPNISLNVLIGALLGFIIALAVLVLIVFFRDAVDSEDWIINTYRDKIPMLAVIPDANSSSRNYRRYNKKYGYRYGYAYDPKNVDNKD